MGTQETAAVLEDIDELDRGIVNALQIHPRAPWTLVGEVLGVDPVTVSRRWRRLADRGLAWVTAHSRPAEGSNVVIATVEIETVAGASDDVARQLAAHRAAVNVKRTAGGRDIVVTVQAAGLDELARYLAREVSPITGVKSTRTHVATMMPVEGSRWRLRSLDAEQRRRMERAVPAPVGPMAPWHEVDGRLMELLGIDGRMPLNDLAARAGTSVATVRRRLRALVGSRVVLRCDIARPLSGWPVSAIYLASAPAEHLNEVSRVLAGVPEVRSCMVAAGPHNLIIDVWLRGVTEVHALEAYLSGRLARLTIEDRAVVLATVKHMGRLLDEAGRCVGVVPMAQWAEPGPAARGSAR
ncbi:Lrp/AsnC family transcriptional regulator [Marinactinospora rubrisoli]|uniref:Lrp/AsnC family transcriptional regulator n=1 Tax=Marinactinospora rubrisoli TaxID=2715399 RepID=A0ABW2KQQ0_9ACTN